MALVRGSCRPAPTVYFKNAYLIDGTGAEPRTGGLVVRDGRIVDVGRIDAEPDGAEVINLEGRTLMPGMVLAHVHLTYHDVCTLTDLDVRQPPEVATIAAVCNARTMLDCGFTAGVSAGAPYLVDIHVRNAINAGRIPGPRLLAAGRAISQTGGMLDWNPGALGRGHEGPGLLADGPWEVRRAVRQLVKDGADLVKMYVTGEGLLLGGGQAEPTCTQDEVTAMTEEAHRRHRLCAVRARNAVSCRMAARAGVDLIGRATMIDQEALDAVAAAGCFLVPGLDNLVSTLEHAREGGFAELGSYNDFLDRTHCEEELDAALENLGKARTRGIKVLLGADFGCAWCPHGTYARELTHLVQLAGHPPMDVLVAATRHGAEAMRLQDEIGTLQRGKRADLIVVDGNPLHDIILLEDRKNIRYVMKGGEFFRRPAGTMVRPAAAPAPAPAYA
jgi:imidazolonepropionase-like amidohydrolase